MSSMPLLGWYGTAGSSIGGGAPIGGGTSGSAGEVASSPGGDGGGEGGGGDGGRGQLTPCCEIDISTVAYNRESGSVRTHLWHSRLRALKDIQANATGSITLKVSNRATAKSCSAKSAKIATKSARRATIPMDWGERNSSRLSRFSRAVGGGTGAAVPQGMPANSKSTVKGHARLSLLEVYRTSMPFRLVRQQMMSIPPMMVVAMRAPTDTAVSKGKSIFEPCTTHALATSLIRSEPMIMVPLTTAAPKMARAQHNRAPAITGVVAS